MIKNVLAAPWQKRWIIFPLVLYLKDSLIFSTDTFSASKNARNVFDSLIQKILKIYHESTCDTWFLFLSILGLSPGQHRTKHDFHYNFTGPSPLKIFFWLQRLIVDSLYYKLLNKTAVLKLCVLATQDIYPIFHATILKIMFNGCYPTLSRPLDFFQLP